MVLIQSRKFLGCLALRTGVWMLGLLSFMLGAGGSVIGWLEIVSLTHHPVPLEDKIFLFIRTIVLSLLALISLAGVLVGWSKSLGFAYIYSKMVASHFLLLLVALALALAVTLQSSNDEVIKQCINGSTNRFIIEFCSPGWSLVQATSVGILGAAVLVQIYAFIIASNFVHRLDLETLLVFPDLSSGFHPWDDKPTFLV
jgi:hypothetical protein